MDDTILRMAASLGISKWRALRIKVATELKAVRAELELEEDADDLAEAATLRMVLIWMDQIEEALGESAEAPPARSREFSGPGIGEWDDLG